MATFTALRVAVLAALALSCTDGDRRDDPARPPASVDVGYMWWAPGGPPGEFGAVMVATVRVTSLRSRASDSEVRPGPLFDATFDIHEVLSHRRAIATKHAPNAYDYAGEPTLEITGLDQTDLAVGDALLIFLDDYEGAYALVGVTGTNSPLGYRLERWDDPIVDLTRRRLLGQLIPGGT